jgi:segregation and condensation protein A
LERRPQLGHDVFGRGQPEIFGVSVAAGQAVDVVEFLWASLALFDDDTAAAGTATVYQARPFELYQVAEARERILRRLAEAPEGALLERFLPDPTDIPESGARGKLRLRSAWSSTFIAGWNWPGRAMWCWGREEISRPSMSPRRPLGHRPGRRGYAAATP